MSGWTENVLYAFQGGSDGGIPLAGLILDRRVTSTALPLGAARAAGGTVFELTPSNGSWTLKTLYSLAGGGGPTANLVMDGAGNLYGTT